MDEGSNHIAHLMREKIARLEEELVQLKKRISNYQKSLAVLERGTGGVRQNRVIVLVKEFLAEHPRSTFEQIYSYIKAQSVIVGKMNPEASLKMSLSRAVRVGTIVEKNGLYSLNN